MSGVLTMIKGRQDTNNNGDAFNIRDQPFHSPSTSLRSSTYSTGAVSLECSSCINDLHGSALSSPHDPALSCATLQPAPLKLPSADNVKLSPPLKLRPINISCPPAPLSCPRKVEHDHGAVKRSMALMKLRRQGSHPPAAASNKSCHGSFNQAAAARELMASLERLSMKEEREGGAAQRGLLLAGAGEGEERLNRGSRIREGKKAELPLTAKIAAAMDAKGLIIMQQEICTLRHSAPLSSFKPNVNSRKPRRAVPLRCRWIILPRLRFTRPLLGKIWIKFKRAFSSSSRKHFQKKLFKFNT